MRSLVILCVSVVSLRVCIASVATPFGPGCSAALKWRVGAL